MKTQSIKLFLIVYCMLLLSGCGGGGGDEGDGGVLYVSVDYSTGDLALYSPTTVYPDMDGFQGHAPNCRLIYGAVPFGMTLNNNCTVSGTPTSEGNYSFGVRVGASGVSNTIDTAGSLSVRGPRPSYWRRTGTSALTMGASVNDRPNLGWTAPTGLNTSWSYQIQSGSLPPGLTLDSSTGAITGTANTQGRFTAYIVGTLTTSYGTYRPSDSLYDAEISAPTFGYTQTNGGPITTVNGYVSQPLNSAPATNATGTLSAFSVAGTPLPAGLSLNASTGVISGTPTAVTGSNSTENIPVNATLTNVLGSNPISGTFSIYIRVPVYISYMNRTGTLGSPMTINPIVNQISPIPVTGATYSYTPRAGAFNCTLPPGMTLNTSTGVVSGTPTARGTFSCFVDIVNTNNAVSWSSSAQVFVIIN